MNRYRCFGGLFCFVGLFAVCNRAEASAMKGSRHRCGGACCAAACAPCVQYDVVYDVREIECCRTVVETLTRPCTFTRCRTVYTNEVKLCPDTVCKTVYRNAERPYTCTEMKPVYTTVEKTVCRQVCEPVTTWTTCCVDLGHWERPTAANGCCDVCPVWVPKIVEKRVPVTHYESRTVTEKVPVQVCRMVPQQVTKFCKFIECATVKENVMRKIPYIACRQVTEQVTKQIPYTVCRLERYKVQISVPRCVPRPCTSRCSPPAIDAPPPPDRPALQQTDIDHRRIAAMAGIV